MHIIQNIYYILIQIYKANIGDAHGNRKRYAYACWFCCEDENVIRVIYCAGYISAVLVAKSVNSCNINLRFRRLGQVKKVTYHIKDKSSPV